MCVCVCVCVCNHPFLLALPQGEGQTWVTVRAALKTLTLQPASRSAGPIPWTSSASTACRAHTTSTTPPRPCQRPMAARRSCGATAECRPGALPPSWPAARSAAAPAPCANLAQPRAPRGRGRGCGRKDVEVEQECARRTHGRGGGASRARTWCRQGARANWCTHCS